MTTTYTITPNEAFKSLEIAFNGKPSEAVRDALKELKYRWHGVKKIWYGYSDEETVKTAIDNAENGVKVAKTEKVAEKVNKYGVKVGDVFYSSWGYDQTNVDWFQVVELVGECSARICEISPIFVKENSEGFMCANRTYKLTAEPMPKSHYSVHIKDNEKGDVKRIQKSGETIYFKMASYANAYKVEHGEREVYESWYA